MRNKGQGTIEYMVLIGIIVAGLIAMQVYVKRGAQGRIKSYADQLSDGGAYSPAATNSYSVASSGSEEHSNNYSVAGGAGNPTTNITETSLKSYRTTVRTEEALPFANEPQR